MKEDLIRVGKSVTPDSDTNIDFFFKITNDPLHPMILDDCLARSNIENMEFDLCKNDLQNW